MSRVDELLTVLSRATPCDTLKLLQYSSPRGRLTTMTWSARQRSVRRSRDVPASHPEISLLMSPPLLRPTARGPRMVVVMGRGDLVVVGWELRGVSDFDGTDVTVVTTLLPLLRQAAQADLEMSGPQELTVLTRRETDVLLLVGQGLTDTATARRCGISTRTVNKHLEHAYRKIGCHDRVSAVQYLSRAGLLMADLVPG